MKLRLKDREQQAWLDKVTGGLFSESLNLFTEDADKIEFQICDKAIITFKRKDLEIIDKYHQDFWNAYPEVTPPEDVLMRVETGGGKKFCGYYHAFAEGGCWCYEDGTVCPEATSKSVKRFRPWE
mgnify:CR=1 FL=1